MKHKRSFTALTLCAALLLSGCNAGTPAPAVSESETTTSAAEITTAEATTTSAAATTAVTTTAEPEPVKVPASITAGLHNDDRFLRDSYGREMTGENTYTEYVELVELDNDFVYSLQYLIADSDSQIMKTDGDHVSLTIDADAANIMVRPSVNAMSDKSPNDIKKRLNKSMYSQTARFGSAYEIKYDDPVAVAVLHTPTDETSWTYNRRYDDISDVTLGYTISELVTVNAFVCDSDNGLSVLIDPEYMYGLPMLSSGDIDFTFGNKVVTADSLLFTGAVVEGLAFDTADYAYAKVTLLDTHVSYSYQSGYMNTCTVADIEMITAFSDIAELDITNDTNVLSGKDKEPEMLEVYNAVMDAKNELFTAETRGIILLDLDFDGTPEVIVTRMYKEGNRKLRADSDVYSVRDGALMYIDTLHPLPWIGESLNSLYLGLTELPVGQSWIPGGKKAWYMTKRIDDDEDDYSDDSEDCLYTLDGDTFTEYKVFNVKTIKEPTDEPGNNDYEPGEYEYYMFGEKIVPIVTLGRDPYSQDENDPEDYEYLEWNGVHAAFGMWELFGKIRAWYADKCETSFPLLSDWLCGNNSASTAAEEQYDVSEREFAHKIAYMVDDCYYGRNNGVEHNYWFLGAYAKPVIYLYPEEQTNVSVQVNFPYGGELTCTYPDYGDGWNVTAMPDGTLYGANGDEYYCLYWEGDGAADLDMSKGFCVAGKDTAAFLREKLMYIGLTAREANEFIIYWLPKMQANPYNVITLHTEDYARSVPLDVSPTPDTQIRVFMTYYASDTPVDIPEQKLPHYERNGFTLVEWGGSEE